MRQVSKRTAGRRGREAVPGVCYNTDVCITFVRCALYTAGCFSSCLHIGVIVTHNEWSSKQADSTCEEEAFYAEGTISGPLLVSRTRLTRDMICPTAKSIRTQLILYSSLLGQGQDLLSRSARKSVDCSMLYPEVQGTELQYTYRQTSAHSPPQPQPGALRGAYLPARLSYRVRRAR